jgi:hypothetical protein
MAQPVFWLSLVLVQHKRAAASLVSYNQGMYYRSGAPQRDLRAPWMPTVLDPSLTLTRTQYPAIVSITENRKPPIYAEFASSCNTQLLKTAHS